MDHFTGVRASVSTLAGALISSQLVLVLVLGFVFSGHLGEAPLPVVALGQVAAAVGLHLVVEQLFYRAAPVSKTAPRAETARPAVAAWQAGMFVRFALSEAVSLVSLAAAFVVSEGGYLTFVLGAALSVTLMLLHVWPWARPVGKVQENLDREGGRSHLDELLGLAPWTGTEADKPGVLT